MKRTTWLRYVGASIMGILDPIPSTAPSLMAGEEGAWVRAHAWTKALRNIEDAYPHGFHRWCSCEAGTCHPCRTGHHDRCVSRNGPRFDRHAGTLTDRGGFVVAKIHHGPGQHPCRWNCPCTHSADAQETAEADKPGKRPVGPLVSGPGGDAAGQLTLFTDSWGMRGDGDAA